MYYMTKSLCMTSELSSKFSKELRMFDRYRKNVESTSLKFREIMCKFYVDNHNKINIYIPNKCNQYDAQILQSYYPIMRLIRQLMSS